MTILQGYSDLKEYRVLAFHSALTGFMMLWSNSDSLLKMSGAPTDVLVLNFGDAELQYALKILDLLRREWYKN